MVLPTNVVECPAVVSADNEQDDAMQVSEIQSATALNPKSISSRISEMVKAGHVARDEKESGKYRITTAGIHWLNSLVEKKISRA